MYPPENQNLAGGYEPDNEVTWSSPDDTTQVGELSANNSYSSSNEPHFGGKIDYFHPNNIPPFYGLRSLHFHHAT